MFDTSDERYQPKYYVQCYRSV